MKYHECEYFIAAAIVQLCRHLTRPPENGDDGMRLSFCCCAGVTSVTLARFLPSCPVDTILYPITINIHLMETRLPKSSTWEWGLCYFVLPNFMSQSFTPTLYMDNNNSYSKIVTGQFPKWPFIWVNALPMV